MPTVEETYAANVALRAKILSDLKAGKTITKAIKENGVAPRCPRIYFFFETIMDEACKDVGAGATMGAAFKKHGITTAGIRTLAHVHPDFARMLRVARARHEQVRGGPEWEGENNGGIKGIAPNINRTGRPSTYSPERGNRICAPSGGALLPDAVKSEGISCGTALLWAARFPDFGSRYKAAIKNRTKVKGKKRASHSPRQLWGDGLIDILLGEIAKGRSISDICTAEDMPSAQLVYKWARERADFAKEVEEARKRRNANDEK